MVSVVGPFVVAVGFVTKPKINYRFCFKTIIHFKRAATELYAFTSLICCFQACRSSLGMVEQFRSYYVDWRMLRDVKRRQMAYEYADTRLRINAIRKNTILPKELQVCLKICSFHLLSTIQLEIWMTFCFLYNPFYPLLWLMMLFCNVAIWVTN